MLVCLLYFKKIFGAVFPLWNQYHTDSPSSQALFWRILLERGSSRLFPDREVGWPGIRSNRLAIEERQMPLLGSAARSCGLHKA